MNLKTPSSQAINLLRGWPAASLLPASLIRSAAKKVLSDESVIPDALWYGPDPGYEPLRNSIAEWLTSFFRPTQATTAERICITGGASQNLGCMLSVYTDPEYTRNIWIVSPAYFLAFRIFEDAGFSSKLRAVPEDEEGLDMQFLRREIEKSEKHAQRLGVSSPKYKPDRKRAKVYKHVIYCVPTFSNPSSRTMSLDRRRELVKLAREYDGLVVCDDVYDFLQWPAKASRSASDGSSTDTTTHMDTAHLLRVVDVDRALEGGAERPGADGFGNVCSNGSFSKIVGPGVRVGWVEGTEKFAYGVSQTGTTCSGGAPGQLTSTYIHELLVNGSLQDHIRNTLIPAYASRYRTLMRAISEHLLPLGFALPQTDREISGGYFAWLSLPSELKAADLVRKCKEDENVIIAGGKLFEVPGDEIKFERSIRLCWAWEDETVLEEGVGRVGRAARILLEGGHGEEKIYEAKTNDADLFK